MGRVWAFWPAAEGAGETDPSFQAIVTVTDGAGNEIASGKHVFHRPPWSQEVTAAAAYTFNFSFTPQRGSYTSLKVKVEPDPDFIGPRNPAIQPNFFKDPGLAVWELVPEETWGNSGEKRVLNVSYVAPLVGEWKAGGKATSARAWMKKNADKAEEFLIQNLPIHAVKRHALTEVPFDEPDIARGPCPGGLGGNCAWYSGLLVQEKVEDRLVREFVDQTDYSIVVMLLPDGYAGDQFRGKTFFNSAGERGMAFISELDMDMPDAPVVILPVTVEPWVLAHEIGHAFVGKGHIDLPQYQRFDPVQNAPVPTGRYEGIHAFRIPSNGKSGAANKNTEEGNSESLNLVPLMKEGPEQNGLIKRFISDRAYKRFLDDLSSTPSAIWASAASPDATRVATSDGNQQSDSLTPADEHGPFALVNRVQSTPQTTAALPHLIIDGAVGADGSAQLGRPRIAMLRPRTVRDSTGPFRIELRDASGAVLAAHSFELLTSIERTDGEHTEEGTSFAIALPAPSGLQSVVLLNQAGRELSTRSNSGSAPTLRLRSARFDARANELNIQWESTPADTAVRFDVFYSADGAAQWSPVARSTAAQSVVVPAEGLRRGPSPRVRVVASNGFNFADADAPVEFNDFGVWSHFPAVDDTLDVNEVWVTLNSELEADVKSDDAISLRDPSGKVVAATTGYDASASRLWLAPDSQLTAGATYRATISRTVRDRWGNRMSRDFVWTFRTAPDTTPPRLVHSSPLNGDITLPVTLDIAVTFSEPLSDRATRSGSVRLESAAGKVVNGTIRFDSVKTRIFFTPSAPLEPHTTYTLTLLAGITDVAGNQITNSKPVTFTTGPGSQQEQP